MERAITITITDIIITHVSLGRLLVRASAILTQSVGMLGAMIMVIIGTETRVGGVKIGCLQVG